MSVNSYRRNQPKNGIEVFYPVTPRPKRDADTVALANRVPME